MTTERIPVADASIEATYRAAMHRFWQPAPRLCLVCDQPFRTGTAATRQVYCSVDCQQVAMRAIRLVKEGRAA